MLELKDAAGLTPFHLACAAGRNATVQFLLECGSDLHTTDWVAATPLHTAAQRGHLGTVPYTFHKVQFCGIMTFCFFQLIFVSLALFLGMG